jgi:hypothetical protein
VLGTSTNISEVILFRKPCTKLAVETHPFSALRSSLTSFLIKQFLANPQTVVTGATITGNRVSTKLGKTRTAEAAA